jgi:hypothetical protein
MPVPMNTPVVSRSPVFKEGPGIGYGLGGRHKSELADTIKHAKPHRAKMGCAIERHRRNDTAVQARM